MRLWLICFAALFGVAELFPWLQGVALPLPLMVGAGVLLAIVSNRDAAAKTLPQSQPQPAVSSTSSIEPPPAPGKKSPELPTFQSPAKKPQSISFTIRKLKP